MAISYIAKSNLQGFIKMPSEAGIISQFKIPFSEGIYRLISHLKYLYIYTKVRTAMV